MAKFIAKVFKILDISILFSDLPVRKPSNRFRNKYKNTSDIDALQSDWIKVGKDLRSAMAKFPNAK